MKTNILAFVAELIAIGLAASDWAVEPAATGANRTWTLATDDTELTLAVTDHAMSVVGLRNPAKRWNWTAAPSRVPMPAIKTAKAGPAAAWEYRDATEDRGSGILPLGKSGGTPLLRR